MIGLTALTDDEARDLLAAVYAEVQRRDTIAQAPAQAEALAATYAAAIGRKDGDPWTQPTGAHDAVPLGATVTHGGKTWESLTAFNVWAPSPSSPWWKEVTDNPGPQPWALGTYYFIDTRVTFGGQTWRCLHEHLAQAGWEPGAPGMHAVWSVD